MDETDIWRSAHLLIQQHGEDAELAAAKHLDAMIERGDPGGEAVWKCVLRAINALRKTSPAEGERTH
jgi:hypothetical protein